MVLVTAKSGMLVYSILGRKTARVHRRDKLIFHPLHYLALLERKTGALEQAAPLEGWQLPEEFVHLRRLLQTRMGKAGSREYIQVLRLLEDFRLEEVRAAVGDAMRLGAICFDAVKHLLLCRIDRKIMARCL